MAFSVSTWPKFSAIFFASIKPSSNFWLLESKDISIFEFARLHLGRMSRTKSSVETVFDEDAAIEALGSPVFDEDTAVTS